LVTASAPTSLETKTRFIPANARPIPKTRTIRFIFAKNKTQASRNNNVENAPDTTMGVWIRARPIRVRAISMDVTGTLLSFRGSLQKHYLGSALKCGVPLDDDAPIERAFHLAYKEMSTSELVDKPKKNLRA
jgi:hypothetical protein